MIRFLSFLKEKKNKIFADERLSERAKERKKEKGREKREKGVDIVFLIISLKIDEGFARARIGTKRKKFRDI